MRSLLTVGSKEAQERATNAALITAKSRDERKPQVVDVIEILKRIAGMQSMVPETPKKAE